MLAGFLAAPFVLLFATPLVSLYNSRAPASNVSDAHWVTRPWLELPENAPVAAGNRGRFRTAFPPSWLYCGAVM